MSDPVRASWQPPAPDRFRELRLGAVPRGSDRGPVGGHLQGSQRGLVRDRRGWLRGDGRDRPRVGADRGPPPAPGTARNVDLERTLDPGLHPRPGRGPAPLRRQAPGQLRRRPRRLGRPHLGRCGDRLRARRGALVSLVGGLVFVPLVTDFEPGTQFSVFLWLIASVGAGVISGGSASRTSDRAAAVARERLAGNRLHRLQAVTEVLAGRRPPRRSLRQRSARRWRRSEPMQVGSRSDPTTIPTPFKCSPHRRRTMALLTGWRRHPIDTPAPGPEIVRTGRPIFIETRRELLARFPLVTKIEKDRAVRRIRGRARASRGRGARRAQSRIPSRPHGAPGGARPPRIDRPSGGHRAAPHPVGEDERRARATAEHAEDRLRKLQAVSDAANAATGLDELVETVLPVVRDAVLADGASFLLAFGRRQGARSRGGSGSRRRRAATTRSRWAPAHPGGSAPPAGRS